MNSKVEGDRQHLMSKLSFRQKLVNDGITINENL